MPNQVIVSGQSLEASISHTPNGSCWHCRFHRTIGIRRYVEQMRRLRPELAIVDMLLLAVAVHEVASPLLPEQVAVLSSLEPTPSLHDKLCK